VTAPATLAELRVPAEAGLYPRELLDGCADALVLFAAGFYGRQDAVWVADAGLTATCIDRDRGRLDAMADLYPDTWEFVCTDAFAYAERMDGRRVWDVVSLDPSTNLFTRCAALAPLWARLARRNLVIGCGRQEPPPPPGWHRAGVTWRSDYRGGTWWAAYAKDLQ